MKLLSVAVGLLAAELAEVRAHEKRNNNPYIPWDCYYETQDDYGHWDGNIRVSDLDLISGLEITGSIPQLDGNGNEISRTVTQGHQIASIAVCKRISTGLVSGAITTWGKWNAGTSTFDDLYSLNMVGNMSGLQTFDDNAALVAEGLTPLTLEQDVALIPFWYQEASPEQEDYMLKLMYANQDEARLARWKLERHNAYEESDLNSDGKLDKWEGHLFFDRVRQQDDLHDYRTDSWDEKADRQWNILSIMSQPTGSFTLEDYYRLQEIMTALYKHDKLAATGHGKGILAGDDLSHHCNTHHFGASDSIGYIRIASSDRGVTDIELQTRSQPLISLVPSPTSWADEYVDSIWETFEDGVDSFFGLWGTSDETTGDLHTLGFIKKDHTCQLNFERKLAADMNWNTPIIPGPTPTLGAEYQRYLDVVRDAELVFIEPTAISVNVQTMVYPQIVTPPAPPVGLPRPGGITETQPVTEPTAQPTTEPAAQPATEPAAQPATETAKEKSAVPDDNDWLENNVREHKHTGADGAMVAFTLIIWALVLMVLGLLICVYRKGTKQGSAISYETN